MSTWLSSYFIRDTHAHAPHYVAYTAVRRASLTQLLFASHFFLFFFFSHEHKLLFLDFFLFSLHQLPSLSAPWVFYSNVHDDIPVARVMSPMNQAVHKYVPASARPPGVGYVGMSNDRLEDF